jgi:hypothetical protein
VVFPDPGGPVTTTTSPRAIVTLDTDTSVIARWLCFYSVAEDSNDLHDHRHYI